MDIQEQEKTFSGFMKLTKYGLIAAVVLLVVLASIA